MPTSIAKSIILFIAVLLSNSVYSHPGHGIEIIHSHAGIEILILIICILIFYKLLKK